MDKMNASQEIENNVITFSDNAYGVGSAPTLTMKELKKCYKTLNKYSTKTYVTYYLPEWSKKYPMWLNRILFYLFNNKLIPFKLEKYL